jgi:hypothetical protein
MVRVIGLGVVVAACWTCAPAQADVLPVELPSAAVPSAVKVAGSASSAVGEIATSAPAATAAAQPPVKSAVRVLSDGGDSGSAGSSRLFAPVRALGGDVPGGDELSTVATIASRVLGGGGPTPARTRGLRDRPPAPYTRPVISLYSGGAPLPGEGGPGSDVGDLSTLDARGTLAFTGAGLVALVGMGLALLSSGAALRRIS